MRERFLDKLFKNKDSGNSSDKGLSDKVRIIKGGKRRGMRVAALVLCAAAGVSLLTSCSGALFGAGREKTQLKVGNWPVYEDNSEEKIKMDEMIREFKERYPDIDIIGGYTYQYDARNFAEKFNAGELPTFLEAYYTELPLLRNGGYAADITKALRDNNLLDKINPEILGILTDNNGKICGVPSYVYAQGLAINKKLFEQAGLMNDDGTPKVPSNYTDLAEYSQIIKEKTGTAGFVMPTTDNCGGWIFMNIAWSFGVTFEEYQKDSGWKAVFDTDEFREALKYVYDLNWKYNALPDDKQFDYDGYLKCFGSGEAAMMIADPAQVTYLVEDCGMDKDDIYFAKMPAGPKGRYSQLGGGVKIFFSSSSDEENDAGVKWLMMNGLTPNITPEVERGIRDKCIKTIESGGVVFPRELLSIWQSDEWTEKINAIYADYTNVHMENFKEYCDFTGVILRPEETVCCQQLYSVLDKQIQKILLNENVDINAAAEEAVREFQEDYLNKWEW